MKLKSKRIFISLLITGEVLIATGTANAIIFPAVAASVAIQQRRKREQAARLAARQKYLAQLEALRVERSRAIAATQRKKRKREQFLQSLSSEQREQYLQNEFREKVKSDIHNIFILREQNLSTNLSTDLHKFKRELYKLKLTVIKMTEALLTEKTNHKKHDQHVRDYISGLNDSKIKEIIDHSFSETMSRIIEIIQDEISVISKFNLNSDDPVLTEYLSLRKQRTISQLKGSDLSEQYKSTCESIRQEMSVYLYSLRSEALKIESEKKRKNISVKKGFYHLDDYEQRKGGGIFGFLTKEKLRLKKAHQQ